MDSSKHLNYYQLTDSIEGTKVFFSFLRNTSSFDINIKTSLVLLYPGVTLDYQLQPLQPPKSIILLLY